MRKGLECVVCGKDATKYWFGGQPLCDEHFNMWKERADKIRQDVEIDVYTKMEPIKEEKIEVKKKKENVQSQLF